MIWHLRSRKLICLLLVFTCSYIQPQESKAILGMGDEVRAFPTASGYGAGTVGGRGGRVIFVDTLDDDGLGSLRAALEASGRRIVIFRTAGVIKLESTITVKHPYLTVAGQTAPSPGITLRMDPSRESTFDINGKPLVAAKDLISIQAHDVVMRYLKLRRGDTKISGRNLVIQTDNGSQFAHDVIIDHMSFSWSTDESVDIYTSETLDPNLDSEHTYGINNVTISNSIIAESLAQDCLNWLNPDSATHLSQSINGYAIGDPSTLLTKTLNTDFKVALCVDNKKGKYFFDKKGEPIMKANIHPLGMVIGGYTERLSWHKVQDIDLHHNLFAHNTHRNPRVKAHGIKIVNNYIYNWFTRASETMLSTQADYIGNIFQHGPLSSFQPVPLSDPLFIPGNEELVPNVTTGKVYRKRFLFHDFVGKALDPVTKILVPISPDEGLGSLYLSENIAPAIASMQENGNDNWSMLLDQQKVIPLPLENRRYKSLSWAKLPIAYTTPTLANKLDLMNDVGANKRLLCNGSWVDAQDFVDKRVIREASNPLLTTIDTVTAIYKTAREAGPLVQPGKEQGKLYYARPDPYSVTDPYAPFNPTTPVSACLDSDVVKDGMPDDWEGRYGRDFIATDDTDHDGYTNIEEYINGSDPLVPTFSSISPKIDVSTIVDHWMAYHRALSSFNKLYDLNHNNVIDAADAEILKRFFALGQRQAGADFIDYELVLGAIAKVDPNSDGVVSPDEYRSMYVDSQRQAGVDFIDYESVLRAIAKVGPDSDGVVSPDEYRFMSVGLTNYHGQANIRYDLDDISLPGENSSLFNIITDASGASTITKVGADQITTTLAQADLNPQLTVSKPTIKNNPDTVTVTLRVMNLGPSKAFAVKTSLPVPATMQVDSLPVGCTLSNGLITCHNDSILSGSGKDRLLVFKVLDPITVSRDVYFENARASSETIVPSQLTIDENQTNDVPARVKVTCTP